LRVWTLILTASSRTMTQIEKTTYGETYVVQDDGSKVIPESKRPDGTYRKPIRVKEGFTPAGETRYDGPAHIAAQKQAGAAAAYPTAYEEPGSVPLGERRIPGFTPDPTDAKPAGKKSRRRKGKGTQEGGAAAEDEEAAGAAEEGEEVAEVVEEVEVKQPEPAKKAEEAPKAEPVAVESKYGEEEKAIRKAKKKLVMIETLEKRGPPYTAEEQEKVDKKDEFLAEIKYWEKVAAKPAAPVQNQQNAKAKAAPQKPQKQEPQKQEPASKSKKQEPAPKKAEAPASHSPKTPEKVPAKAPAKEAAPAAPKMDSAEVEAAQKRLRNVKKKLAEIEKLQNSGKDLDADQMDKVSRKGEFDAEMKHLSKQLGL